MDAASFQFVFFGLAAALVSNFSRSRHWRSAVLLVASFIFIALLQRHPLALVPMAGFLLAGFLCLMLLQRGLSRLLPLIVVTVVFGYIWLKRYTFLPEGIFLSSPYFAIGLSYIFFRVLHVLIEAGEGGEKQHIGFWAYLLYTLNFTTFVSGPIQRYDDFVRDQFAAEPTALGPGVIGLQLERIIRGFFKVNVLATIFEMLRQDALARMALPSPPSARFFAALSIVVLYPLFLYSNFSGYIDIVISLARLMRVRLPENFDRPFSAPCFIDFWSRWHITLSNWLKAYVFNPLLVFLMRRISAPRLQPALGVLSFFVTFFLIGLWHGRTSEFIIFGILQGGGVAINKLWQLGLAGALGRKRYKALTANIAYVALARGLTFSWFAFTLFWFWGSWVEIHKVFGALSVGAWLAVWLAAWLSASVVLALWEWLRAVLLSIRTSEGPVFLSRYARVMYASAFGFMALVTTVLLNQPVPDIVYKAF